MQINDIQARAEEIQMLIAGDRLPDAIKRLMDFATDFSSDRGDVKEVIVVSAKYYRIEKMERRGAMGYGEADQQRSKLLYQALDLIDSIQEQLPGAA